MTESYEEYSAIKLEEVCRLCLSTKEQMTTLSENGFDKELFECIGIQVLIESFYLIFNCI